MWKEYLIEICWKKKQNIIFLIFVKWHLYVILMNRFSCQRANTSIYILFDIILKVCLFYTSPPKLKYWFDYNMVSYNWFQAKNCLYTVFKKIRTTLPKKFQPKRLTRFRGWWWQSHIHLKLLFITTYSYFTGMLRDFYFTKGI